MKSDRILVRTDMDEAIRLLGLVKKFVLQRKLEIFQQTHAGKASVSLFIYADALRQTPKYFTCCAIYLLGAEYEFGWMCPCVGEQPPSICRDDAIRSLQVRLH